ncbi:Thaumatin-like protein 1 [Apostasia shenzhenica]|uniref:Thaumatin-like protein 1 n=1 Tax=Apostasia shenzhenica TaxID=1088818 RepID=A0A2I0AZ73_9ASPA|nr:Thaumatin-like protein 1 [Apostasia shenzhenica]
MASTTRTLLAFFVFLLLHGGIHGITFTVKNNCGFTIWPATLSSAAAPPLQETGFILIPGASAALPAPAKWSGRIWARTHCSTDSSGRFSCLSGDCGTGTVNCSGSGGAPPASLAEFTLDGADGKDFYDTSLVDGFNLPVAILPDAAGCNATSCAVDVDRGCPPGLRETSAAAGGAVIGCMSPCVAFREDEYCCSGRYNDPKICKPTNYSMVFKRACPQAYSYPYDDATSTFTCVGANYVISFCP